jgi:hypothetical protein
MVAHSRLFRLGAPVTAARLSCWTFSVIALLGACGGAVDDSQQRSADVHDGIENEETQAATPTSPVSTAPDAPPRALLQPTAPPPQVETNRPTLPSPASYECVALPLVEPRQPQHGYTESCAVEALATTPDSVSSDTDARPFLVGRWQLCGEERPFGQTAHAGLEFGSNGRVQLLQSGDGALIAASNAPTGSFTLLPSGQFMLRGALSLDEYAVFTRFDASFDTLEIDAFGTTLRYARVAPDTASAARNVFSTQSGTCVMAGVWDTASDSVNTPAAFAFNETGEWFGGKRGANLCDAHGMYGTYELTGEDQFNIVTNVGAGVCQYWFDASFSATFSQDCNQVRLTATGDNCTGGRGVLDWPGDVLVRRQP